MSLLPVGSSVTTPWLSPGPDRSRRPDAVVATFEPAVKVGIASGPGVGAAVAVAGGSEVDGTALLVVDATGLVDGDALGDPNRHPPRSRVETRSANGAGRRMRAA
jgi:hypothetical protein